MHWQLLLRLQRPELLRELELLRRLGMSLVRMRALGRVALLSGSITLLGACAAHPPAQASAPAASSPDCSRFWQRMSVQLPGTWQADLENGKQLTESFSLVSNQSALVERFITPSGKQTISVYHPDQRSLMLTHYCGQGNQPRLRSAQVDADQLVLRFLDATNMSAEASVLVEKRLRFLGQDAFDQTEIYRGPDGALEETVFHFKRTSTERELRDTR